MKMTYTKRDFRQRAVKNDQGKWRYPGMAENMQEWALARAAYNGHKDVDVIVDSKFERAFYCNTCGKWGSLSSLKDEFGIFGTVVFKQCAGKL